MLRRMTLLVVLGVALGLVFTPQAKADSVSFNMAISGGADTFVSSIAPDRNFGNRHWMGVGIHTRIVPGRHHHPIPLPEFRNSYTQSLLRFDNLFGSGQGQIPLGSRVTRATLRLYGHWGRGSATVGLYRMTRAWDEDTATWASLGGGVLPGVNALATPDAELSFVHHGHGWIELDVTQALQAWASGENNFGWGLIVSLPDWGRWFARFRTKEAGARWAPTLNVEYSAATPEPATAWLVVGAVGLIGLRRRRSC